MLNVLGLGWAIPRGTIDNALLEQLPNALKAGEILNRTGLVSRPSILGPEYIKATHNIDPWLSKENLIQTPTDLSYSACVHALDQAGITPESIGLLIGECATPLERTPSEGQRLGKKLGIKVPAYDVLAGSLLQQLDILASWKPELVPDYVSCLSSNTPSQRVNFSIGSERYYFGDAAVCWLVSSRHPGVAVIKDVYSEVSADKQDLLCFDTYAHASLKEQAFFEFAGVAAVKSFNLAMEKNKLKTKNVYLACNYAAYPSLSKIATNGGCAKIFDVSHRGENLGGGGFLQLSEHFSEVPRGANMLVVYAGLGFISGYCLMEKI